MLPVTIHANGDIPIALLILHAVDTLSIDLENRCVTLSAGLRPVSGYLMVVLPLDLVNAVAIRTDCRELDQSVFHERPSVNAPGIFGVRTLGLDVILLHNRHVFMASGAGLGDLRTINSRGGIQVGEDSVFSMAVITRRSLRFTLCQISPAMDTVRILFILLLMAPPTINCRHLSLVRQRLDAGVAADATHLRMNGFPDVLCVDRRYNLEPQFKAAAMALQAVTIGERDAL